MSKPCILVLIDRDQRDAAVVTGALELSSRPLAEWLGNGAVGAESVRELQHVLAVPDLSDDVERAFVFPSQRVAELWTQRFPKVEKIGPPVSLSYYGSQFQWRLRDPGDFEIGRSVERAQSDTKAQASMWTLRDMILWCDSVDMLATGAETLANRRAAAEVFVRAARRILPRNILSMIEAEVARIGSLDGLPTAPSASGAP